jgi:hypothetical protein
MKELLPHLSLGDENSLSLSRLATFPFFAGLCSLKLRTSLRKALVLISSITFVVVVVEERLPLNYGNQRAECLSLRRYMSMEPRWNDTDRENPKNLEKICPSAALSTTN